ncbi:nitric oxide reductase transcriptional regulator NorR [Azospirillum picis]|uniref:Anaerobic nitric oxide reductase transcription regulator n=1 Tax=Azospirillum picis TaxID=488438 RepID=A0ABU0MUM1_9PROT|nr:nitric oxide reductase transcriptional regulator NorR [Azospirillum picis]MBP2303350.1 anaerobic nitric oxide reductase transcription regulator [Azospirillum picis]MDQ0537191.1 anaerobic nitric oxide reductase transcription regulator [Azospirillum picis]
MDNGAVIPTTALAPDEAATLLRALEEPARLWPLLLDLMVRHLPCDACALLRHEGGAGGGQEGAGGGDEALLVPLATRGLSPDTLGRRFPLDDHPRLRAIAGGAAGPLRFPADCDLPDPYDGLIPDQGDRLHVHDCIGAPLAVDGRPWGVLTLDALNAGRFDGWEEAIAAWARLAEALAATVESRAAAVRQATMRPPAFDHQAEQQPADPRAGADMLAPPGASPAMAALLAEIDTVAASDLVVLVLGETGVGKELVAHRLHARSGRSAGPLVQVNCAALPEALVESELFGHVRGAFSGALADRRGKFELADGGTLFLDEVGELPAAAQAKMLRALQNGEIQRVGSDRNITVDVRVVAATNRDLATEVREGRFRADVYHRLSVYPLRVPPLRDRGADVLRLAGLFLERNRARLGLRNLRLSAGAERCMLVYPWPGNVRELEHAIGRGAIRARVARPPDGGVLTLTPVDLGLEDGEAAVATPAAEPPPLVPLPGVLPLREATEEVQRRLIQDRLQRHGGNWAQAARSLGLDRSNLFRLARRLGLRE